MTTTTATRRRQRIRSLLSTATDDQLDEIELILNPPGGRSWDSALRDTNGEPE